MSDYSYRRDYRGKVKALVLDWSGTVADAYVLSPVVVFVEIFKRFGVEISMSEARGPMGMRKDVHIRTLTEDPSIRERWHKAHGRYPDQSDVDAMFKAAVPVQLDCLPEYTELLPGIAEVTQRLQSNGIKIGSTTGFTREMVAILEKAAIPQGYTPDCSIAGDDVENGSRPAPFMLYRNLDLMNVFPIQSVVKVDDTTTGIHEGLNAGCWTVGVTRYSNYMDVNSVEEADQLSADEIARRKTHTADILIKSGAHYTIDSLAGIEPVIEDINRRLAAGERP